MIKAATNVQTLGDRVQIKVDVPKIGIMDTSSMNVANETGEIVGIGSEVTLPLKIGDKIMFKSWAVDIVNVGGEKFHFISQATRGICGKIK